MFYCIIILIENPHTIKVRIAESGWQFSGDFEIDAIAEFPMRVRNCQENLQLLVNISVKQNDNGSIYVLFIPPKRENTPYIIKNFCSFTISFNQKGNDKWPWEIDTLSPLTVYNYSWDYPSQKHRRLVVRYPTSFSGKTVDIPYNLEKVAKYKPLLIDKPYILLFLYIVE